MAICDCYLLKTDFIDKWSCNLLRILYKCGMQYTVIYGIKHCNLNSVVGESKQRQLNSPTLNCTHEIENANSVSILNEICCASSKQNPRIFIWFLMDKENWPISVCFDISHWILVGNRKILINLTIWLYIFV